jgi:hypothetical protein
MINPRFTIDDYRFSVQECDPENKFGTGSNESLMLIPGPWLTKKDIAKELPAINKPLK